MSIRAEEIRSKLIAMAQGMAERESVYAVNVSFTVESLDDRDAEIPIVIQDEEYEHEYDLRVGARLISIVEVSRGDGMFPGAVYRAEYKILHAGKVPIME